ncbi:MAG: roadblock/LC7 domain-containing protein [Thermaceae bacterium]|nr:roadblock/LC7 domain-containing protein [Thermaceae bacterium]
MSKQETLYQAINQLRASIPELRGAIVASSDGLAIAHSLSNGEDPNRVAAMAATALGLGKRISESLNAGSLTETSVSGTNAQIYLYAAGQKGVLAVVAPAGANIGLIHMEARETAKAVASIL